MKEMIHEHNLLYETVQNSNDWVNIVNYGNDTDHEMHNMLWFVKSLRDDEYMTFNKMKHSDRFLVSSTKSRRCHIISTSALGILSEFIKEDYIDDCS